MKFPRIILLVVAVAMLALVGSTAQDVPPAVEGRIPISTQPFGVRLAFADDPAGLTVTWSTTAPLKQPPCVEFELDSLEVKAAVLRNPSLDAVFASGAMLCGSTRSLQPQQELQLDEILSPDAAAQALPHYVHVVTISGISPGARYGYKVGNAVDGWSPRRTFTAPMERGHPAASMVVFGDLGVAHSLTLPAIEADVATGAYAAAIHVGDIAYDLPQLRGGRAVQFLKLVEPVSSAVPYMVSPGNHEAAANFSMYKALFSMPGYGPSAPASENLHYSYDVGSVHVVSFNTEVFFWPEDWDESHMQRMYDWMAADLAAAAAEKAAGGAVKWIVVVGHRPHYCAAAEQGSGRCGWEQEASRLGIASTCPHNNPHACRSVAGQGNSKVRQWPIEQLLSRYGVDLVVFGHIHCYERYNAVYNYTVVDTPGPGNVFVNPRAPVHVTVGGAGNVEMRIGPGAPPQGRCASNAPWCAFQSGSGPSAQQGYDFSYGRVSWNVTSMHWQQVSVTFGRVIDEWWIKRSHF